MSAQDGRRRQVSILASPFLILVSGPVQRRRDVRYIKHYRHVWYLDVARELRTSATMPQVRHLDVAEPDQNRETRLGDARLETLGGVDRQ